MIVDIELTRRDKNRYAARALQFPDLVVEAPSREDALTQIRQALLSRQQAGVEFVQITLDETSNGTASVWPRHAGMFPDDETTRIMLSEIEQQRKTLDQDAGQ
ncbi:MAG: hypothetical protein MUD01_10365 [Chloroflexaceae bacterium]|jgi:hypothetical protein|nr:hypothetical protein [Chloroflexaceae bacterium]